MESYYSLIQAAKEGLRNAFTVHNDDHDARFGAAVLTSKGNIYSAGQYYSDTFSLTLHAEQAAITHAASHGEYAILAVAVIGNHAAYEISGGKIYPCHLCKQVLWESHLRSGLNTEILIVDLHGNLMESLLLLDMMHQPWPISKHQRQS